MEKIYFDNYRNNFWLGIIILATLCFTIGIFEIIKFSNPNMNDYIRKSGFLFMALYYSKMFWYRNYVQWNKKGAMIRINSFFGKSITFLDVHDTELHDRILSIKRTNRSTITLDLNRIAENDVQRLHEIILKNSATPKP